MFDSIRIDGPDTGWVTRLRWWVEDQMPIMLGITFLVGTIVGAVIALYLWDLRGLPIGWLIGFLNWAIAQAVFITCSGFAKAWVWCFEGRGW